MNSASRSPAIPAAQRTLSHFHGWMRVKCQPASRRSACSQAR
jgi:hypothetical protein